MFRIRCALCVRCVVTTCLPGMRSKLLVGQAFAVDDKLKVDGVVQSLVLALEGPWLGKSWIVGLVWQARLEVARGC